MIKELVTSPNGIILVTGPTGSGKTTTLYAVLQSINKPDINIITIEDPIEYQIKGISQIQVNPKIDLTFARGLRSIVRQDPDVILVGEIRDEETAEMAFRAAMTGHQVYSTLHTNSAVGAFPRLIDTGVTAEVMAGNMIGIIAQRLIRRLRLLRIGGDTGDAQCRRRGDRGLFPVHTCSPQRRGRRSGATDQT